jgi:hypothetical protein
MNSLFKARPAARCAFVIGLLATLFIALAIDTSLAQGPFGVAGAAQVDPKA